MMKTLTIHHHHHHHHLALLILLSVCLPLDINGWSFGLLHPNPNSMSSSPLQAGWILPTPRSRIQKKRVSSRKFPTNSLASPPPPPPPMFEITDNDQEFEIAMDVPGVKREDINVDYLLLENGAVISIRGLRRVHNKQQAGTGKQVVEFSQSFALDPAVVDVDKLTANLENGVLIVSAPKEEDNDTRIRWRLEDNHIRKKIPIHVPADKDDDDDSNNDDAQANKTMGGGGGGASGAFDARNESNFRRQPDPIEEEEEDLNAT